MPEAWDEFTDDELRQALAETRGAAEDLLELARDLEVKLPGTRAAFRSGILRESKVAIIARAVRVLDPEEARAAEALVLGREADPGRAPGRDRPGGHRNRARHAPGTAQGRGEGRAG